MCISSAGTIGELAGANLQNKFAGSTQPGGPQSEKERLQHQAQFSGFNEVQGIPQLNDPKARLAEIEAEEKADRLSKYKAISDYDLALQSLSEALRLSALELHERKFLQNNPLPKKLAYQAIKTISQRFIQFCSEIEESSSQHYGNHSLK